MGWGFWLRKRKLFFDLERNINKLNWNSKKSGPISFYKKFFERLDNNGDNSGDKLASFNLFWIEI